MSAFIDTSPRCPHCGSKLDSSSTYLLGGVPVCPKCGKPTTPLEITVPLDIYTSSMVASGLVGGTLHTMKDTVSVLDRVFVSGWDYRPVPFPPYATKYSTDPSDPEPLLKLGINAVYRVRAWLLD